MKCPYELQKVRNEAKEELKREEQRLDEVCRQKHAVIVAETIEFCEEVIGVELERTAKIPNCNVCYVEEGEISTDRLGNKIWHPLYENGKYANGAISHRPQKQGYDVATINNYLRKQCFSVDWTKSSYKRWGWGEQTSYRLKVSASVV